MYLISIIIPVYNVEETIRRAFNSIIEQTLDFNNLEVIFVDDCSTDNSYEIIHELEQKYTNVKIYSTDINSGNAGKARNIGLKHANADYIMFLDSDDYYESNACEKLYNEITGNDEDLVIGTYNVLSGDEKHFISREYLGLTDNKIKVDTYKENYDLLTIAPSIWSKIFKKKFIKKYNLEFKEEYAGEDLYFITQALFLAKGIIYINLPIVNYVKRDYNYMKEKSITDKRNKKTMYGLLDSYDDTYNLIKKYEKSKAYLCLRNLNYWMYLLINSDLSDEEKLDLLYKAEHLFKIYKKHFKLNSYKDKVLSENIYSQNHLDTIKITNTLKFDNEELITNLVEHKLLFILEKCDGWLFEQLKLLKRKKFNIQLLVLDESFSSDCNFVLKPHDFLEKMGKNIIADTSTITVHDKHYDTNLIFYTKDDYIQYIIENIIINEDKKPYLISDNSILEKVGLEKTFFIKILPHRISKYKLEKESKKYDVLLTFNKKHKNNKIHYINIENNQNIEEWKELLIKTYINHQIHPYEINREPQKTLRFKRRHKRRKR